jgi:putative chitinase
MVPAMQTILPAISVSHDDWDVVIDRDHECRNPILATEEEEMLTREEFLIIMPLAKNKIDDFLEPLNDAMHEGEIDTGPRMAAFLAQLAHESGQFRYMQELADGSAYDNRKDLGNTRPEAIQIAEAHGSTPGRWWKGHGPIQITGYDNHRECSETLYGDPMVLLHEPLRLTRPTDGCRGAVWFWTKHGLNGQADKNTEESFRSITRTINGGLNGYADRRQYWLRALSVLGAD